MSNDKPKPDFKQISVIVPVKDEAGSIFQLLQGLQTQRYQPSEIVITDGGSTDLTREIIRYCQNTSPIPILLIETDHALPGRGRNLAIARARHEWLASIDAGIRPSPDWLNQLVTSARRDPQAEVIYGVAQPLTDTYFKECAAITYIPGGSLTKSIASCLMRRSAWSRAGGFREDLRSGEDLLFFQSLEAAGVKTSKCSEAVVLWEIRPTLASTFRRFLVYSRNGMRAGLAHQWQYNVARLYVLMLVIILTALGFWPLIALAPGILLLRAEKRIFTWYRSQSSHRLWWEILNARRVLTVAVINVVIDIATICGMWQWFVHDRTMPARELDQSDYSSSA